MATRNTPPPTDPTPPAEDGQIELDFGGELDRMLTQAARPTRWFVANPKEETSIPEGAIVQRGYPVRMAGLVTAVELVESKYGTLPVYVLDVGKGPDFPLIRFGLTATVLRSAHERLGVQVGDTIAAVCPGLRQGRDQEYEDWNMVVTKGRPAGSDPEAPF